MASKEYQKLKEKIKKEYNDFAVSIEKLDKRTIIEKAKDISEEDVRRLEAVIYTMADKFLEKIDLDEVRSEMRMTELGKMLYKEAEKKVKLESAKNLLGILNDELIAEKIGIPLEDVLKLKEEMK